jgi:uncharacterized protein (TIGR02466 family)
MTAISLFPTLVYKNALENSPSSKNKINKQLLKEIHIFHKEDKVGQNWSRENYRHGYTSYGSRDRLFDDSPTFFELKNKIDAHVKKYLKALHYNVSPQSLSMNTMWMNVMPKGAYHTMHIHPQSVISGTYYVNATERSSAIQFEDPRMGFFMNSPLVDTKAAPRFQRFFKIHPHAGDVVLFESWIRHEVSENEDTNDRISVSFNYDWVHG